VFKKCIVFCIFMTAPLLICQLASEKEVGKKSSSIIKQVDHILLTPEDPQGLFDFLSQELKLPIAWPYQKYGGFASGGVFAGNVNLEALIFPHSVVSTSSKIAGIAFEPSTSTEEIVKELDRRQIAHGEPETYEVGPEGSKVKLWTNTIIENMVPGSFIFICEYHIHKIYKVEPTAMREKLEKDFKNVNGGLLGIEYVSEIKIKLKNRAKALEKWQNLLKPYECFQDGCFDLGKGPSLRFLESDQDYIYSLKLKVQSLKKAGDYLSSKGLIHTKDNHMVTTNPVKTFGIIFEFFEIDESSLKFDF